MGKAEKNMTEYYVIDMLHIAKSLWRRIWLIVISGFLAGVLGFVYSAFFVAPTYSASVMLYVNNSSISLGNASFNISSSDISAAQSLVDTYREILNNRTTLERVIDKANLAYDYEDLKSMVTAGRSNDTEIMKVTVVAENPYVAANIANCIAEVLPVRISEIIDGASMEIVDTAVPDLDKIAPSITKYVALAFILGCMMAVGVLTVLILMDDRIHEEDYILQTYDYPILAKIPDLMESGTKRYGYYYKSKYARSQYYAQKQPETKE